MNNCKNCGTKLIGGLVTAVAPGSIALREGLLPGDIVTEINGRKATDTLDLMWVMNDEYFELTIVRDGEEYIVELEPEEGDFLGLSFKEELFNGVKKCPNNCIFCFVDQQPEGLRETLNIKDEDYRTSFLHGSFITMTNLERKDLTRIEDMHLSPLYVSVHATNEVVRAKLLGRKKLPPLLPLMRDLGEKGISFWTQIVLIPEWNDGEVLVDTLSTLHNMSDIVLGIAVVPIGLTKHRDKLPNLKPMSREAAIKALKTINEFRNRRILEKLPPLVFAADELILRAEVELPNTEYYEDFALTENGVGLLREFLDSFEKNLKKLKTPLKETSLIVTGEDGGKFFQNSILPQIPCESTSKVSLAVVKNQFLGENVTVAGLLSGADIENSLLNEFKEDCKKADQILICDCCIDDENRFIDNKTVEALSKTIGKPVIPVANDGLEFIKTLKNSKPVK
jgi:putative radical SAM enzyme (TIGR03279 family)